MYLKVTGYIQYEYMNLIKTQNNIDRSTYLINHTRVHIYTLILKVSSRHHPKSSIFESFKAYTSYILIDIGEAGRGPLCCPGAAA